MASLLDKVKAAVGNGTLMPNNYNDAISASRNDPEVRAYLESITPKPAPTSPVSLFNSIMSSFGGGGRTLENTTGATAIPQVKAPSIIPERFTKVDNRGLPPASAGIYGGSGNIFQNDPIIQRISGAVDTLNANQAAGFQDWLKTPAGRSYTLANAQNELRRQIPTTPLGKSLADTDDISNLIAVQEDVAAAQEAVATEARQPTTAVPTGTEKTEDLTPEAKTFNVAATTTIPEGVEDKQNWFDSINDRVDLMAMGAAMLAGSGQRGANTLSRLGQGLQAGIASRAGQAKAAEDKQYRDALLVLKAMEERRLSAKDREVPALSYPNQVDSLEALIRNQGGEGDNVSDLARSILIRDPQFGLRTPEEQVKAVRSAVTDTSGFIYGGSLNPTKFSVVPPKQAAK